MRVLVTGVAGFIGSHLAERLLADGNEVIGLDCFTEYYDRSLKEANLAHLLQSQRFEFVQADLCEAALAPIVDGCEVIFHLAAQPGVRRSWGPEFQVYLERNVSATQRLLEAARGLGLMRFVFASSSSIYGEAERYPTVETDMPQPVSPYGVTKLAAERLCLAYHRSLGVPVVVLRYFTVYGPRQRPDMAFSRFIHAIECREPVPVYGDGHQTRDFTSVADVVEATVRAAQRDIVGESLNVGGGSRVSVLTVLDRLGQIMALPVDVDWRPPQPGDVRDTGADLTRAGELLGYSPRVSLEEGLASQVNWARGLAEWPSSAGHKGSRGDGSVRLPRQNSGLTA